MAATTATRNRVIPIGELQEVHYTTASTANSGDTLDVTADFSSVKHCYAFTAARGLIAEVTESSGTLTIDASGGATNTAYSLVVVGVPAYT